MNNLDGGSFKARHLSSVFGRKVTELTETWKTLHERKCSQIAMCASDIIVVMTKRIMS